MKDGRPTILYTKETRLFLHSALCLQSNRATEQQSNRATEQQSNRATEQQSNRATEQTAAEQSADHPTGALLVTCQLACGWTTRRYNTK
jgi:hypothetical protein